MFLVEKRLALTVLLLLVSVSFPCNENVTPYTVSSEVTNKKIKLKKVKNRCDQDNESWTSTFFDAHRWRWLKAIWENHHLQTLTYLVLWPLSYLTVRYFAPIIWEMIVNNWPLILLIITVIIYLQFLHDEIMMMCIMVISKPAILQLLMGMQEKLLATLRLIFQLPSLIKATIRNHYFFIWLAFIGTYLNVSLLPDIQSEQVPTVITLNSQLTVVFVFSLLSEKTWKTGLFLLLQIHEATLDELQLDFEDVFATCCFLKATRKLLMFSKLMGCCVVSSKVKRGPTISPKQSTTVTYISSSDCSDTSGSSQDSNASSAPEHKFRIVEKVYKTGKKKGKSHTTVSLLINPFEFKKRTDRSKEPGGVVYFSCNGCTKLKFYNKAVAVKVDDKYELVSWPASHKCCPTAVQHLIVEFRRSLYDAITADYSGSNSGRPAQLSLPKLYEDKRNEFARKIKNVENKDLFYNLVPKFRNLQKGLYEHRSQFLPTTPLTQVSVHIY